MGTFIYTVFVNLYQTGIRIAALWNPKAKLWVNGRRDIFSRIAAFPFRKKDKVIWMHCASLGEFEQGRPLLEATRAAYTSARIVLSFFSPSGYEVMKEYPGADLICYLPMDSLTHARQFISLINPSLVFWVKYEYWFHYLSILKEKQVPVLLVSGIFRRNQPFFRWYGTIWRNMLGCFTHFFVQNEESKKLLEELGTKNAITVCGDTRFDRVQEIARHYTPVPGISTFCGNYPVIVAGSTWEEDDVELLHFVKTNPYTRFIIAPHEVDEENLAEVKKHFPRSVFYSEWMATPNQHPAETHVLIIDNIGMLSRLYRYATVALVGGGFGADGVHNVLEAAVYGKPVVFGPVYEKYDEAVGLLEAGGACTVDGPLSLEQVLHDLFTNDQKCKAMGTAAGKFVAERSGATQVISAYIQEKRLLTS